MPPIFCISIFKCRVYYEVNIYWERDRSVGKATIHHGLNCREVGVRFPVEVGDFFFRHNTQTSSGVQSASCTIYMFSVKRPEFLILSVEKRNSFSSLAEKSYFLAPFKFRSN
jgi:hypothetical protein